MRVSLRAENEWLKACVKTRDEYIAEINARHNALVEAVAWERECECVRNKNRMFRNWPETVESERSYDAARAEVDRLIGEGE